MMFYWGIDKQIPELLHHNVFFGNDYRESFEEIFERGQTPKDPAFYVNVPARSDPSLAPAGKDGLYVLIPVPSGRTAEQWRAEQPGLRQHVLDRLKRAGIPDFTIQSERVFTPDRYLSELNLERGAAFGLSHDFFQVGPFRPKNCDHALDNLYYVGASTQPGTGLPMVMISARLCADRIALRRVEAAAA
jgi:phytoene desaturase